jgi:hypothetical protein
MPFRHQNMRSAALCALWWLASKAREYFARGVVGDDDECAARGGLLAQRICVAALVADEDLTGALGIGDRGRGRCLHVAGPRVEESGRP